VEARDLENVPGGQMLQADALTDEKLPGWHVLQDIVEPVE
jgi:hypothetical protein